MELGINTATTLHALMNCVDEYIELEEHEQYKIVEMAKSASPKRGYWFEKRIK